MTLRIPFALLLVAATSTAQRPEPGDSVPPADAADSRGNLSPAQAGQLPLLVPVHTAPAGLDREYGIWAAGPTYKASFHDGFTFFPFIPGQKETRGLHWHTESVRLGSVTLPATTPSPERSAWRCEYRHAGFTEAYQVLESGVEQTFVITEPPATPGSVTVTARIDTPFAAAPRTAASAMLDFATADGVGAVHYGAASVADSAGHTAPVLTSFDGQRIVLEVPAAFVAQATFPITIDPLVSAVQYAGSSVPCTDTAIAAGLVAGNKRVLACTVRQFSTTDYDLYAYLLSDAQAGVGTLIFADATAAWSAIQVDAAQVDGTQTWVMAIQRDAPGPSSTSYVYQHQQASTVVNSGTNVALPASTARRIDPRIGGANLGENRALMVFENVPTTGNSSVLGVILDTQTLTFGPTFDLHSGSTLGLSCIDPHVTKLGGVSDPWRVTWAEDSGIANARWIQTSIVSTSGIATHTIAHTLAVEGREPRIGGGSGRYVITWLDTPTGTNGQLHTERFDYPVAGTLTNIHQRVLATASTTFFGSLANGDIAFDLVTLSHWAVTYRYSMRLLTSQSTTAYVVRLGHTGGVTESQSLHAATNEGVANPSVAFDGYPLTGEQEGFVLTYSTAAANNPAFYRRFTYTLPPITFYGTSCRSNTMGDGHPPYAGSEFYRTAILGLPANTFAVALLGFSPTDQLLDPYGLLGCHLLVNQVASLTTVADANGLAMVTFPLGDDPVFLSDIYLQWAWADLGANSTGFVTGRGMHILVQ